MWWSGTCIPVIWPQIEQTQQCTRSGVRKRWIAEELSGRVAEAGPGEGCHAEREAELGSHYHLWSFFDLLTVGKIQVGDIAMLQI